MTHTGAIHKAIEALEQAKSGIRYPYTKGWSTYHDAANALRALVAEVPEGLDEAIIADKHYGGGAGFWGKLGNRAIYRRAATILATATKGGQ